MPLRLLTPVWPRFGAALLLLALLTPRLGAQIDITHLGGTASWTNPAGWDVGQIPGSNDNAIISAGTLTVDGTFGINALRLNGGSLVGEVDAATDSITVFGSSVSAYWRSGSLSNITLNIAAGADFEIDHSGTAFASASVIKVHSGGVLEWEGGDISLANGSAVKNFGIWNDSADGRIHTSLGATGSFTNESGATYTKSSSGTTEFDLPFNNDGTVTVNAGTLKLDGTGTTSTGGTISTATGATVLFDNNYTVANAGSLQGTGLFEIDDGTLSLDGITLAAFRMDGGGLTGDHTFAGTFQWNNGEIKDGTTLADLGSNFQINDSTGNTFSAHAFTNRGSVYWNDGDINLNNGSTFTNEGTFTDAAAGAGETHLVRTSLGSIGTFTNATSATMTLSGGGITTFSLPLENHGNLTLSNGSTLVLDGGGTLHSGAALTAGSGTFVTFHHDHTVQAGESLQGDGQFTLADGSLTLNGIVSVPDFAITGGTLLGDMEFANGLDWSGGTLGLGELINGIESVLTIINPSANTLSQRTLRNDGQVDWSAGDLVLNNGSSFASHGSFFDSAAGENETRFVRTSLGSTGSFQVGSDASYTKLGAGETHFDLPLTIDGYFDVTAGSLVLDGKGQLNGTGTLHTGTGTSVTFDNDYTVEDATSLSGTGQFTLANGKLTMNGTVGVSNFTITGGTLTGTPTFRNDLVWNDGVISLATVTNDAGSVLSLNDSVENNLSSGSLVNNGQVDWNDGNLLLNNGSTVTNSGTWNDSAAALGETHRVRTSLGSIGSFHNLGTYTKLDSGTTSFDLALHNDGSVDIQHGTLVLDGGGSTSSTGGFDVDAGASLVFRADYSITDATTLTGPGQVSLEDGTLTLHGTLASPDFLISGGTLAGSHTITANATFSGGSLGSAGSTTNAFGSTFTLAGASQNLLNGRSFINHGTTGWDSGRILLNNAASIVNQGTFIEATDADLDVSTTLGSAGTFSNNSGGLLQKDGTGTTTFNVAFHNSGNVAVNAGTLRLHGGGSIDSDSSLHVASGAVAAYSGNFTVTDAAGLSGLGLHRVDGGTFDLNGVLDGELHLEGGTLLGSHTLLRTFAYNGGTIGNGSQAGTTTVSSDAILLLQKAAGNAFNLQSVDNYGQVRLDSGNLLLNYGSSFFNRGSLLIDSTGGGSNFTLGTNLGTMGYLANHLEASITHQGTGTTTILVPFDNDGFLYVNHGQVVLVGGGSAGSDAVFTTAGETGLVFNSDYTLGTIASLQGNGSFRVEGGTLDASGTLGADLAVSAGYLHGDVTVEGTLEFLHDGYLYGHTLHVGDGGSLVIDSENGLTLDGTGTTIAATGQLEWIQGDLNLGFSNSLTNEGNITFDGAHAALNSFGSGSSFGLPDNLSLQAISSLVTFANHGTLTLSPEAGSLALNLPVTHSGTIELQGGQLSLTQDATLASTSSVILGADTEFRVSDGTTTITDASIFSGDGALVQLGGTLALDGTLGVDLHLIEGHLATDHLTLSRSFRLDDATLATDALIELVNGATGQLDPVSLDLGSTRLSVDASSLLTWQGGSLFASDGGGFDIAGLMFAESDDSFSASGLESGRLRILEGGQFRKTGGTETTSFNVPVFVEGRFEVHTGSVDFTAAGASTGGYFDLWSDTTLRLTDGYHFGDGTTVANGGRLELNGGTFTFDGDIDLGHHTTLNDGTFTGTHTLAGNVAWVGGTFDSTGTTTIANAGTLNLVSDQTYHLDRPFTINGQFVWQDGDIDGADATLTNNGNLLILTDGLIGSVSGNFSIQNNGIIGKVGGTGTSTVDVPVTNAGTVFASSGTLHFADAFTFAGGTIGVSNGGKVTFAAPLSLPSSTVLAGNGTITADITTGGTISPGASVGSLAIDGDLTLLTGATSFFEIDEVSANVLAFDTLTVTGTLTLAGDLQIDFLTSLDPISTDMFTLYTAANLQGDFANVANGGQIWAGLPDGGSGIFTVNYGADSLFDPNSVILTNFEFTPVPEPSTWALMITGLGLLALRLRRRTP